MNSKSPPLDLTALRNALASLQKAVVRWQGSEEQDEELRDACIQRFEYTFELSWKMLKRRLEIELPDSQSVDPRPVPGTGRTSGPDRKSVV